MKTAILFSGGKDSCLALKYALENTDVRCLITLVSQNSESFMFHTPNILLAQRQAEAIGLPIIMHQTLGEKEKELDDLEKAIFAAKKKHDIGGVVTGALASAYQASRVQRICDKLDLECFNPLWQKDQFELLEELIKNKFEVIIVGVFALGMDKLLGKKIDKKFIEDIKLLNEKYSVNPAGEGGEAESFVLNAPFFKKKIVIEESHVIGEGESKILVIDKIKLAVEGRK